MVDRNKIIELAEKVCGDEGYFSEDATYSIMSLFDAIGYDVFNNKEFIHRYKPIVADDKNRACAETVDFAIQDHNNIVAVIENIDFDNEADFEDCITRLAAFLHYTKAKIAIATNGDRYQVYTDSMVKGYMDNKPVFTFQLSKLNESYIKMIDCISKEQILKTDFTTLSLSSVLEEYCDKTLREWLVGKYTNEFLRYIKNSCGAIDISDDNVANILRTKFIEVFR